MSAPISIPVSLDTDPGVKALIALAGGWDKVAASGKKANDMFTAGERAAQSYQTRIEAGTKALLAMADAGNAVAKSMGLVNDAFKLAGDGATLAAKGADNYTTAINTSITANQRFVSATADGNTLLRQRATELKVAMDAQRGLNDSMRSQPKGNNGSGSGDSGSGGRTGVLGQIGGLGYIAGYAAYSALTSSIGRDTAYSRALGSTAAMTGLSASQAAQLSALTRQQAGSGTQPFDATTLLQGSYSLASLGIGNNDPQKINQIETVLAKLSAAGNASDTSVAGNAVTSFIASYGLNNRNVVGNATNIANQLQVGVKLGKVDLPTFATQASGPLANMAMQLGVSTSDVIAGIAAESVGGVSPGSQGQDYYALLASSARPKAPQTAEASALGINYNSGFWGKYGVSGGSQIIEQAMQRQGITGSMQVPVLTKLFGLQDAATAFMGMQAGNVAGFAPQVANSSNAVNAAYRTSQSYAGNQLADQEAKLATAFDNLTTAALPALTSAIGAAAGALNGAASVFAGPGGKGGFTGSLTGAALTLGEVFLGKNPFNGDAQRAAGDLYNVRAATQGQGGSSIGKISTDSGRYSAAWYSTMGIPLGGLNQVGYAPGTAYANRTITGIHDLGGGRGGIAAVQNGGGAGGPSYFTSPYAGKPGEQSDAYLTSIATGRGAGTLTAVNDALARVKNAISADLGKQAVESALGTYRQVVNMQPNALLSGGKKASDIFGAEKLVTGYERGLRGVSDQNAVNQSAAAYQTAQAMNALPAQLKVVFDQYIADEIKLAKDTLSGPALAKQLGAINAQRVGFANNTALGALQTKLGDLGALQQAAQLGGNTALANRYGAQILSLNKANAGMLGIDPAHLTLLQAQYNSQTKMATPGPQLMRPSESGLGDALAGEGATLARLSRSGRAQDPLAETVRHLQQLLAKADRTIQELEKTNDHLVEIRDEVGAGGSAGGKPTAPRGPKRRSFGS